MRNLTEGVKDDGGKNRLDLLSARWIQGVGKVLTFGAAKYADHNWRRGLKLSRCLAAALRHLFAFLGGEDCDPETGLSHLYHASCSLMFAAELHETHPELDDRYYEPKQTALVEEPRSELCPPTANCAGCEIGRYRKLTTGQYFIRGKSCYQSKVEMAMQVSKVVEAQEAAHLAAGLHPRGPGQEAVETFLGRAARGENTFCYGYDCLTNCPIGTAKKHPDDKDRRFKGVRCEVAALELLKEMDHE